MTRRALVTGGAGFIGSHVADLFLSNGWAVEIIDNLSSGKRENVPSAAKLHVIDIRSPDAAALVSDGSVRRDRASCGADRRATKRRRPRVRRRASTSSAR